MKSNYWTYQDNQLIHKFYYCSSATTSAITRNQIYNELLPKFNYLISNAQQLRMSSWNAEDKEEAKQDCLLKIWQVLSTKLDSTKLQGVLNFLWRVTNNTLLSIARHKNNVTQPDIIYGSYSLTNDNIYFDVNDYTIGSDEYKFQYTVENTNDEQDELETLHQEILKEIDRKIIQQEKLNRINTIYLVLLREYLIANDFNGKGFQVYICDKLQITKRYFYQINAKLNIRTQVFNSKK